MENSSNDGFNLDSRLIVVMPDATVDAIEKEPKPKSDGFSIKTITDTLLKAYNPFGALAVTAVEQAAEIIKAYINARKNGANIHTIKASTARNLQFPPGHPRQGVVYAQHPASNIAYYTAASFHRLAFEHKFSEVIRLLTALGAKEIKVKHGRGWSNDFGFDLSAPVGEVKVSAAVSRNENTDDKLLFVATLKGHDTPKLPDALIWYQHEPTWQAIAESRIQHGLENFSLSLSYVDDYGVNGGLKLAAGNAGLDLGGNFQDHEATVWHISGAFA
ncbi:hypothetical protein I6U33_11980 [Pseudomonas carnis]|uniref:Uncharacterized protein n=1 Tax=Pseudomonas cremoris TaxID=2724178 RepID=A0ABR6TA31_9PSED|nr:MULTISPECIES: hypothetical protein [Pseudomonas]MBC2382807.1 hypothetical protein [Pseudomonas cremoris]MBW9238050.1 hypothetical protein [Pseudomonas carnis]